MATASDLVTFNVSGKIYTVLREPTLSLHPNSLLKQLADEKQNEKEIFVEGMGRACPGSRVRGFGIASQFDLRDPILGLITCVVVIP